MALFSLKKLQYYKNTLGIVGGLIGVIILFIIGFSISNEISKKPPLDQPIQSPTVPFGAADPELLAIKWAEVRLGKNKEDINTILGNPKSETPTDNTITVSYQPTPNSLEHKVIYKDNKAVQIERNVNERIERLARIEFAQRYKDSEIIKDDAGVTLIEGFKVNDSEYVIVNSYPYKNYVRQIIYTTKDRYDAYKTGLQNRGEGIHEIDAHGRDVE